MSCRRYFTLFALILSPFALLPALDMGSFQNPWLDPIYEFESAISFTRLRGDHEQTNQLNCQLAIRPEVQWSAQLAAELLHPVLKASFKYSLLDDVASDFVSLSCGASLSAVSRSARVRPLLLYHSPVEGLIHVSLGKELVATEKSIYRVWAEGNVGCGPHASPWAGWKASVDALWPESRQLSFFVMGERGFGTHSFHRGSFSSFAQINYRTFDAGVMFKELFIGYGNLYFQFVKRASGRNCPRHMTALELGCEIPFSF